MQSEAEITKGIRSVLNLERIFHFKHWGGPMSARGVADIIGLMPDGRFLAIEVKKEGWKPPQAGTKAYKHYASQQAFIKKVIQNKGIGFFATSINDVIENLEMQDRFLF